MDRFGRSFLSHVPRAGQAAHPPSRSVDETRAAVNPFSLEYSRAAARFLAVTVSVSNPRGCAYFETSLSRDRTAELFELSRREREALGRAVTRNLAELREELGCDERARSARLRQIGDAGTERNQRLTIMPRAERRRAVIQKARHLVAPRALVHL